MMLENRVAVVTGAGRGIGRRIALACADAGADVVLAARSVDDLEETRAGVTQRNRQALVVPTDLRVPDEITTLADRAVEEFGPVDVLVNNSGAGGPSAPLWEIEQDDWEETFAVNVTGTYLACRAFLPSMIDRGHGNVVVIGSMTGKRPLANRTPYAASKMALVGLVRTLALEAGPHGVRVNLISPGAVEGPRLEWVIEQQAEATGTGAETVRESLLSASPLRKAVAPEDVAAATVFLASDASGSVTGEDLNVTAGAVMY